MFRKSGPRGSDDDLKNTVNLRGERPEDSRVPCDQLIDGLEYNFDEGSIRLESPDGFRRWLDGDQIQGRGNEAWQRRSGDLANEGRILVGQVEDAS